MCKEASFKRLQASAIRGRSLLPDPQHPKFLVHPLTSCTASSAEFWGLRCTHDIGARTSRVPSPRLPPCSLLSSVLREPIVSKIRSSLVKQLESKTLTCSDGCFITAGISHPRVPTAYYSPLRASADPSYPCLQRPVRDAQGARSQVSRYLSYCDASYVLVSYTTAIQTLSCSSYFALASPLGPPISTPQRHVRIEYSATAQHITNSSSDKVFRGEGLPWAAQSRSA
jgi:hypothetical protein